MKRLLVIASLSVLGAILPVAPSGAEVATGPLRVSAANPNYFADGRERPIYLAGSHSWQTLADHGHRRPKTEDPPAPFDYAQYLDFLQQNQHNFFRLWRWEAPKWTDVQPEGMVKFAAQHPWVRPGPGPARDGRPKFDVTKFDERYFERMRSRILAAGARGIYVAVMLFEGFAAQFTDAWLYHPFNAANNVNGIDGTAATYYRTEGRLARFFPRPVRGLFETEMERRILTLQETYLRKVVDTVNDLDNVLFEVCNEASAGSTEWQYDVIGYVKRYEAGKPKQHPIGMTAQFRGGANDVLFRSPADWISPTAGNGPENYRDDPPGRHGGKVVVNDTDHLWGHTGGDAVWVWKSFVRGLNVLFMDELSPSPAWQDSARVAIGQTRRWSQRINLARMAPSGEVSETRYALADRGKEYLVFQPGDQGEFQVDLRGAATTFRVEWFDVNHGRSLVRAPVKGGQKLTFTTPFSGPAALYLSLL